MTNAQLAERYEVVWNGGTLLPEYASATTLTEAARTPERHSRNPMIRQRPRATDGKSPAHYDTATREAIRALRQDGFTLLKLAERFQIPISTVYNIVTK